MVVVVITVVSQSLLGFSTQRVTWGWITDSIFLQCVSTSAHSKWIWPVCCCAPAELRFCYVHCPLPFRCGTHMFMHMEQRTTGPENGIRTQPDRWGLKRCTRCRAWNNSPSAICFFSISPPLFFPPLFFRALTTRLSFLISYLGKHFDSISQYLDSGIYFTVAPQKLGVALSLKHETKGTELIQSADTSCENKGTELIQSADTTSCENKGTELIQSADTSCENKGTEPIQSADTSCENKGTELIQSADTSCENKGTELIQSADTSSPSSAAVTTQTSSSSTLSFMMVDPWTSASLSLASSLVHHQMNLQHHHCPLSIIGYSLIYYHHSLIIKCYAVSPKNTKHITGSILQEWRQILQKWHMAACCWVIKQKTKQWPHKTDSEEESFWDYYNYNSLIVICICAGDEGLIGAPVSIS